MMTAAEKAMQDVGAALDDFFRGDTGIDEALNMVACARGAYMVERIEAAQRIPAEFEKRRKYAALDAISGLGSDRPNEQLTKRIAK